MDRKVYQVKVGNEVKQYEEGTTFAKIAKEYQKQYENDIIKNNDEEKTKQLKKLVTPFILRRNKKSHKRLYFTICYDGGFRGKPDISKKHVFDACKSNL